MPTSARCAAAARFLAVGLVDEARQEMQRTLDALAPYVARGVPVIGLEPSCLLTFRDELPALFKGEAADALAANALLFEEFLAREHRQGRLNLPLGPLPKKALLHGHCHQKAFDAMGAVESDAAADPAACGRDDRIRAAAAWPALSATTRRPSTSRCKMGELSLLPAVRKAPADTLIVADGTSCRHQIYDGAEREAAHVARVLAMSVAAAGAQRR